MQWKYDNSLRADGSRSTGDQYNHGYAEAHQIRVADVDYDGKDEVLHMGYAINGDGTLKYHIDEIIHGDRWFVGSFRNGNNGKEMLGYGVQQRHIGGLLEYIYSAATGEMLWTNYSDTEELIDVGRGNVGDIDPRYEGFECWSFQGLYTNEGKKISSDNLYPSIMKHASTLTTEDLASQISQVLVFDYLLGNWDRFSGVPAWWGVNCQFKDGKIVSIDNGAGFQWGSNEKVTERYMAVSRFSRRFVQHLRHLERDTTCALLFPNPDAQDEASCNQFWKQRVAFLERVDSLIAQYGRSNVLAFP